MKARTFRLPESLDKSIQDDSNKKGISWSENVVKLLMNIFK